MRFERRGLKFPRSKGYTVRCVRRLWKGQERWRRKLLMKVCFGHATPPMTLLVPEILVLVLPVIILVVVVVVVVVGSSR